MHHWSKVLLLSGHYKAHNDDVDDPAVTANVPILRLIQFCRSSEESVMFCLLW